MFQNTDFSYTNSYDEEKMFELLAEIIIKGIKEDTKNPFDVIILEELFYCRGILLNGKNAKDIINYYIGHYYKFYKTTSEMDFEMASPSPVPPNLRVMVLSSWEKNSKIVFSFS